MLYTMLLIYLYLRIFRPTSMEVMPDGYGKWARQIGK